jgi:hypothetical protein
MFETSALLRPALAQNEKGVWKENHEPGKAERGVNEDISFHLNAPENAFRIHQVFITMEYAVPTRSVEIDSMSRSLILDTGSNISILQPGISRCNVQVTTVELTE